MDSIEKAIVDVEKQIVSLFNKGDIKSILEFFGDEFIGFSSTTNVRLTNLSQLEKTFLHYLDLGKIKYSIKNVKVHIYGETALTTFFWNVEIKKGKKKKVVEGRASHVFIFTDSWKIVHEHYSKSK